MILLTDEEILRAIWSSDYKATDWERFKETGLKECERAIAKEQIKKTLISVGKESKRMDGTIYLVPDYVEYRKALKEVGLE